jgi:hypothetical protein
MTATDTEIQTDKPLVPDFLPGNVHEVLKIILDAGNATHLDEQDRIVAGTPGQPGRPVPTTAADLMAMVASGLVAGERGLILTTRVGRHLVSHGALVRDEDIALNDVDLAAWGRGATDYLQTEVLEAIDAEYARVAVTRRDALDIVLQEGLITEAEARTDV